MRPIILHGAKGFSHKVWELACTIENENGMRGGIFLCQAPMMEEGYPGNVMVTVRCIINNSNQLYT